jgi:hypothetical protein
VVGVVLHEEDAQSLARRAFFHPMFLPDQETAVK